MNYNWGEPKKNSKLTAIMMTKAEASRKKRLSSVKSTLSNQLHPGAESKLRKKKKSPESARRDGSDLDASDTGVRTPANNNHADAAYDPTDMADLQPANSSNNDFHGPEDASAASSKTTPIFGEFGLHAAAEGLFHPASTIAAFIEHDAKYNDKMRGKSSSKPSSGRSSLSSRSGSRSSTVGEYLPSLETQKLPVLLNDKGRRVKLDSTPSTSSSTASLLLDGASSTSGRAASTRSLAMASTRSDSDLHAPRKLGAVPSSADRDALDFYDHDDGDDTDDESDEAVGPVRAKSSPSDLGMFAQSSEIGASALGSRKSAATLSSGIQQPYDDPDASLTKKFEDLKLLMAAKKHNKPTASASKHTAESSTTSAAAASGKHPASKSRSQHATGTERVVGGGVTSSSARIAKAAAVSSDSSTAAPDGRRRAAATGTSSGVPVVVKTPPVKARKDMKIRNGISLADLKEEHRAALELLKELGGPMDTDVDHDAPEDERTGDRSKPSRTARSTKASVPSRASHKPAASSATATRLEQPSNAATASPTTLSTSSLLELEPQTPSPVSSTSTGGSLVTKLRAAIPSGRAKTPDWVDNQASATSTLSARSKSDRGDGSVADASATHAPDRVSAAATPSTMSALEVVAAPAATFTLSRSERSLENVEEVDEDDGDDADVDAASHECEPNVQDVRVDDNDLWKQYDDDDDNDVEDDEEDDGNDEDDYYNGATGVDDDPSHSVPVTARSVDLYGDDGFETEW